MPPSFVQNYANDPQPNQSPEHWAGEFSEYVGRVLSTGQNPEMLIFEPDAYARHVVGALPVDDTNLTADEWARWRQFIRTTGAQWYQDMIAELKDLRPNLKFRVIPFAQVLCDILEADFMSTAVWTDFFGDSAPHGTESAYFLTSLVLHRVIYGTDADLTGFTLPEGHNLIPEITSNLSAIILLIGNRVTHFHIDPSSPYQHMVY
jgi:hypothetical protein